MDGARHENGIWLERGGRGSELLVLLHGIGANATVWQPMVAEIEKRGTHRWLVLDFRGHGRSSMDGPYGFAAHAANVAHAIRDEAPSTVTIIGHSFGGVVAALVGSGLYGPLPRQVATVGVKLEWSPEEIAKSHEIAAKPVRLLGTREEAVERYLKGAGLFGLIASDGDAARVGVLEVPDGYRVALDPRVFSAVGPSIAQIFGLATCPVRLAAGSNDPMVTLTAMQRIDPAACLFEGLGHNAHWEAPAAVLDFAMGG